jgi:hypothetical protein
MLEVINYQRSIVNANRGRFLNDIQPLLARSSPPPPHPFPSLGVAIVADNKRTKEGMEIKVKQK